ncbi:uncharacterized protein LOC134176720 [Corticium candelabrum]|uniref:uncharacterized protein LOC134176720 n=1 Tax=Corticium candelabrum TaxID=121492 RepID=UPI002E2713C2|nr:uncharacterized protein LOC134176720 [Corticium candelabrum]
MSKSDVSTIGQWKQQRLLSFLASKIGSKNRLVRLAVLVVRFSTSAVGVLHAISLELDLGCTASILLHLTFYAGAQNSWQRRRRCCFWYAFTGVLEAELDAFRQWWNTHRIRKTKTGQCPGGIPEDIFALPQLTGTQDYLCPIDSEVFGEAYEQLASVEPSFYSQRFEDAAQSCLSVMGIRAANIASENCVMNGGLQLGQPSDSFKRLQSCNLLRFTKSNDECLRALATIKISRETELSSTRFSAGSFLATLDTSPGCLQSKIKNIKKTITESSNNRHLSHLTSLSVQGQAARFKDVEAEHFALSLKSLPDDLFKWAINGLQDTLPSATNLQLWKKISCNQCPLCHQPQSLCHVLNACPSLLDRGLYKQRHDNTLRLFVDFLKRHLSQQFSIVADLPESVYNFPVDITCTCLRPDIVVWNAVLKKAWMLELSVPFETVVEETKARKERRYAQLVKDANHQYKTELLHLLVGSRGLIFPETRRAVCMLCKPLQRDLDDLFQAVIHSTLKDSFRCWLARRDNIS